MTFADKIIEEARACGAARIERERALDGLIARAVALHPAGFGVIDPPAITLAEAESAERLLGRVAACVGGARYPARRARLARLRAGLAAQPDRARTLGGCRFVPWRGRVLVLREIAAAAAPARLEPGASFVWDRRFAVELAPTATSSFTLGYLLHRGMAALQREESDLPRLLWPVLPALWDDEGLAAVPHLFFCRRGVGALPRLFFRPAHSLTSAGFTVV